MKKCPTKIALHEQSVTTKKNPIWLSKEIFNCFLVHLFCYCITYAPNLRLLIICKKTELWFSRANLQYIDLFECVNTLAAVFIAYQMDKGFKMSPGTLRLTVHDWCSLCCLAAIEWLNPFFWAFCNAREKCVLANKQILLKNYES